MVEEAVGKITDIHGGHNWMTNPSVIASNGVINEKMLTVTAKSLC